VFLVPGTAMQENEQDDDGSEDGADNDFGKGNGNS
jgi:hypothetical protein